MQVENEPQRKGSRCSPRCRRLWRKRALGLGSPPTCCGGGSFRRMPRGQQYRVFDGMLAASNRICPASTIFAGWRQSVLPVHLLGLDALLGSVGPVAGDVKLQDDGVVHDPVNRRGGGRLGKMPTTSPFGGRLCGALSPGSAVPAGCWTTASASGPLGRP